MIHRTYPVAAVLLAVSCVGCATRSGPIELRLWADGSVTLDGERLTPGLLARPLAEAVAAQKRGGMPLGIANITCAEAEKNKWSQLKHVVDACTAAGAEDVRLAGMPVLYLTGTRCPDLLDPPVLGEASPQINPFDAGRQLEVLSGHAAGVFVRCGKSAPVSDLLAVLRKLKGSGTEYDLTSMPARSDRGIDLVSRDPWAVSLFGLPSRARRVAFVIDGSMVFGWEAIHLELLMALARLRADQSFAIVFYDSFKREVFPKKGCAAATPEKKAEAAKFLSAIHPARSGPRGPEEPVRLALAALGVEDQPSPGSVLYLVSRGAFIWTDKEAAAIREMNELANVRIHTIYCTTPPPDEMEGVMKRIARESNGQYRFVPWTEFSL